MRGMTEFKVGLFVLILATTGGLLAYRLSGARVTPRQGYRFHILFPKAPGIGAGTPVRLAGVDIGEVTAVGVDDSDPANVMADVEVFVRREYTLYEGYRYLVSGGVVFGDKFIEVQTVGEEGQPLDLGRPVREGMVVKGFTTPLLEDLMPEVERTVKEASEILDQSVRRAAEDLAATTSEILQLTQTVRRAVGGSEKSIRQIFSGMSQAAQTVGAMSAENRAHINRLLGRAADTAEILHRVAQENEGAVSQVVNALTATLEALRETLTENADELHRAARGLAGTAEALQRTLETNQESINRTLTGLAAAVETLQRTLTGNEQRLAQVMENAVATAKAVRDLAEGSREDVAAVVANLRGTTTALQEVMEGVRDDLSQTAKHVENLTRVVSRVAAQNETNINDTLTHLSHITGNLEQISTRLRAALQDGKVMENIQTAVATLRRAADQVEQATENVAAVTEEARNLLTDEGVQTDLRGTVRDVRETAAQAKMMLHRANRLLGVFEGGLSIVTHLDLRYLPERDRFRTDFNLRWPRPRERFWLVGVEDLTEAERFNVQYGEPLRNGLSVRYGLYRSKLGLGLDYRDQRRRGDVSLDWFDPNNPQLNLRAQYTLGPHWQLSLGVEDLFGERDFIGGFRWTWGEARR